MKVVVRNIEKKDSDLRERVLQTMRKQIRKKFYGVSKGNSIDRPLRRSV